MYSNGDTIVAIATPEGRGAIGVVRLSGAEAYRIATHMVRRRSLQSRRATLATVHAGEQRDQVVVTWFPGPGSYTGEDVVEISAHGSGVVLRAILAAAIGHGARLAEPGEFTLRAFVNGRIDLPRAEAVADLIDAVTPLQARVAFDQLNGTLTSAIAAIDQQLFDLVARLEASIDFPDEGYHFISPREIDDRIAAVVGAISRLLTSSSQGRLIREGARVAIVGRTNAGKSSLFNALLGADRAIVSAQPGTTRDMVSEIADLGSLRVTLVDTAGFRRNASHVEQEGMARARAAMADADLSLVVYDGSVAEDRIDPEIPIQVVVNKTLTVISKSDVAVLWSRPGACHVSAVTGAGIPELRAIIRSRLLTDEVGGETPAVTNVRHIALLERARATLERASRGVREGAGALSEEFILADLADARNCLEVVTGRRTTDDVLEHVFRNFCIGK